MALSLVAAFVIFGCYVVWEFIKMPDWARKVLKAFIDISPFFVWLIYRNAPSFLFLALCVIANLVIFSNNITGALCFIAAYCFAGLYVAARHAFAPVNLVASVAAIAFLEAALLLFYKDNRIGVLAYGLTAGVACLYAFTISLNFGFLALVIADTLLIVNEVKSNKAVFLTSDFFYFLGICLVPLSLR